MTALLLIIIIIISAPTSTALNNDSNCVDLYMRLCGPDLWSCCGDVARKWRASAPVLHLYLPFRAHVYTVPMLNQYPALSVPLFVCGVPMTTSPVGMSTWEAESAGVFLRGGGYAQWRIQGGGGSRGSGPPLLCHDVGFLTLGPKLDPRLAPPFLLVDLIWTPPFKNPGTRCTNSRSGPRTSPKFVKIIPDKLC